MCEEEEILEELEEELVEMESGAAGRNESTSTSIHSKRSSATSAHSRISFTAATCLPRVVVLLMDTSFAFRGTLEKISGWTFGFFSVMKTKSPSFPS